MRNWLCVICMLLTTVPSVADEPDNAEIEYIITQSKGFSYGTEDGKTVYENRERGSFDREVMTEVYSVDEPVIIPDPTVVLFSEDLQVVEVEVKPDKARQRPASGEDKIFQQIAVDVVRARCFILDEGCPGEGEAEQ